MSDEIENDLGQFFADLKSSGLLSSDDVDELSKDLKDGLGSRGEGSSVKKTPSRIDSGPIKVKTVPRTEEDEVRDLRAEIADMKLSDKIKLAMLGDATARSLLIVDTNRLVQQAVINNPRLQDVEIEGIAKNPNVSDFVLRAISANRTWVKNYAVKHALVTNPKTPQDVGIKWLRFLNKNDLRKIAKSKNIPQLIAVTARKRLADMDAKK